MGYMYRCSVCGCYLDPGEGYLCDECRERREACNEMDFAPAQKHSMTRISKREEQKKIKAL